MKAVLINLSNHSGSAREDLMELTRPGNKAG